MQIISIKTCLKKKKKKRENMEEIDTETRKKEQTRKVLKK